MTHRRTKRADQLRNGESFLLGGTLRWAKDVEIRKRHVVVELAPGHFCSLPLHMKIVVIST